MRYAGIGTTVFGLLYTPNGNTGKQFFAIFPKSATFFRARTTLSSISTGFAFKAREKAANRQNGTIVSQQETRNS
ncbi:MAG TPA: hypothetical protein DEB39_12220 [Planctomycetaceae bacterium]|nr:hypothetical protein [Planctomycetaceae bacterium]